MMNLALTTDKIQLVTSAAAAVDVHASWVDDLNPGSGDAMTPGKTNTAISTATTTDIVPAPAASTVRNVKHIDIMNRDASLTCAVTVKYNANGTTYQLTNAVSLLPGESLVLREGIWFHYDANGGVYPYTAPSQADIQTFTATGANTWTKPTSFTPRAVMVRIWGAGGGGGAGA